ncbi:hypothetical protein [Nostoc sp.]|uniref:hypothetical protein n=1 Tax=Nostoc sp. TaxID=1180 RepID=UPI002FEE737B
MCLPSSIRFRARLHCCEALAIAFTPSISFRLLLSTCDHSYPPESVSLRSFLPTNIHFCFKPDNSQEWTEEPYDRLYPPHLFPPFKTASQIFSCDRPYPSIRFRPTSAIFLRGSVLRSPLTRIIHFRRKFNLSRCLVSCDRP